MDDVVEPHFEQRTQACVVTRESDGLVVFRFLPRATLDADTTGEIVRAHVQAAGGTKQPLLVDAREVRSQDRHSRAIASSPEVTAVTSHAALLVGNPVSRVIASFFVRVTSPNYLTRVFSDEARARAWLRDTEGG